jgi:hypothetical protein
VDQWLLRALRQTVCAFTVSEVFSQLLLCATPSFRASTHTHTCVRARTHTHTYTCTHHSAACACMHACRHACTCACTHHITYYRTTLSQTVDHSHAPRRLTVNGCDLAHLHPSVPSTSLITHLHPSVPSSSLTRLSDAALVGTTDGSFLVRQRLKKGGGAFDNEFILTVVFKASLSTTVFDEPLLQSCQPTSCPLSKTAHSDALSDGGSDGSDRASSRLRSRSIHPPRWRYAVPLSLNGLTSLGLRVHAYPFEAAEGIIA